MKTSSTNKKIRELINLIKDGKLLPQPDFQRRLVWSQKDKNHFLDSILRGYPFPEIYLADGSVDLDSGEGTQLLVDGLQRVSTIIEYFDGSTNLRLSTIPAYKDLKDEDKKAFLLYDVAVRDIGNVQKEQLIEVFQRINATKYSLLDIEVNNAVYAGALKQYAERLAENSFFLDHAVFNATDFKRMGDLRFALSVICTMTQGYFNRDESLGELLSRYNDEFPHEKEIDARITKIFDFLTECGFEPESRIWKKADLFTVLIELDVYFRSETSDLDPLDFLQRLQAFYKRIVTNAVNDADLPGIYYKSAIQATNDKINRLRRGTIIGGIMRGVQDAQIMKELTEEGLIY